MNVNEHSTMKVQIVRPYQKAPELLEIEQARVLVGSGAHCDIRIDGEGASLEHLVVEPRGTQLFVRSLSMNPPVLHKGVLVTETMLPSGAELWVCGVTITFELARASASASRRIGQRLVVAVLVGIMLAMVPGLVFARLRGESDGSLAAMPPAAKLFDDSPVICKATGDEPSLVLARKTYAQALARRERHPFAVEEGVLAVPAFRNAAACFKQGKQVKDSDAAKDDAANLQAIIERDYFAHRVRLEHAIETDDLSTAMTEVRVLRRMTAQRKGPYTEWLAFVERRIESATRDDEAQAVKAQSAFGSSN